MVLGLLFLNLLFAVFAFFVLLRQQGRVLIRLSALERDLLIQRLQGSSRQTEGGAPRDILKPDALAKSRINRRGLAIGSAAPEFSVKRLNGNGSLSLRDAGGKRLLLLFVSTDCAPCDGLLRELTPITEDAATEFLVVARGEFGSLQQKFDGNPLADRVGVQEAWEVSRLYATFKMPSAYMIDEHGRITEGPTVGPREIIDMARAFDRLPSMTTAQ